MALIDQIVAAESGGDPNARNSRSSASGLGQFIDSTWLSTLRRHRPDLAEGKPDADLLALKTDPDLSKAMTAAYAADNSAILSKAGLPVTPGSTYLAHFAGPQGAVGILNADPSTPVSAILTSGAIKANPFLQGMTAADLRAWADRKMGGQTPATPRAAPLSLAGMAASPSAQPEAAPEILPEPPSGVPRQAAAGPFIPDLASIQAAAPMLLPQGHRINLAQVMRARRRKT